MSRLSVPVICTVIGEGGSSPISVHG
ncbi:hypothetical protein ACSLNU_28560, partial [Klebsiella variicola]